MKQTKRSVYYTLLLLSLLTELLALFLPYSRFDLYGRYPSSMSSIYFLCPDSYYYWRDGSHVYLLTVMFLALIVCALLLRRMRRVTKALDLEDKAPQRLSYGLGPLAGILFCLFLYAAGRNAGTLFDAQAQSETTVFPWLGILSGLLALGLTASLNSMESSE